MYHLFIFSFFLMLSGCGCDKNGHCEVDLNNQKPIANAGKDQNVTKGLNVNLSGVASKDPESRALTYLWSLITRPKKSQTSLGKTSSQDISFKPDQNGDYVIQLMVNDGTFNSLPDTVKITVSSTAPPTKPKINKAPIANAGNDQDVLLNTSVALSASGSQDPEDKPLTYTWSIQNQPKGSGAVLENKNSENTHFTPKIVGDYILSLIVNDGDLNSLIDTISIHVKEVTTTPSNSIPTANAGKDQTWPINTLINLSGDQSKDSDSDPLTYVWTIKKAPKNNAIALENPNIINPTLTPNVIGEYIIQLIVNDGKSNSQPDIVKIKITNDSDPKDNKAPTVNAGKDQSVSSSSNSQPTLGTNLAFVEDWTTSHPFIDLFKYSREWITSCESGKQKNCTASKSWNTDEYSKLDLDEQGWVKSLPSPSDSVIFSYVKRIWALDKNYAPGRHIVTYEGEGKLVYGMGVTLIESKLGMDIIDINPVNSMVIFKLMETDPNKNGNYLRNIRVVREKYKDINLKDVPFNPDFLSSLKGFHLLRFMDWMQTNASPQTTWKSRAHLDDVSYASKTGVPIEVQLQLSNQLLIPAWVNIPHQADDNYIRQFASLALKNLSPQLNIYIEFTNEAWNGQFEQHQTLTQQAKLKWPNSDKSDFELLLSWFGHRTAEMCEMWKTTWGNQKGRVKCVMASQGANPWVSEQVLDCPISDKSPCVEKGIDYLSIAAYFGYSIGLPE
jgi:hypothetical protein